MAQSDSHSSQWLSQIPIPVNGSVKFPFQSMAQSDSHSSQWLSQIPIPISGLIIILFPFFLYHGFFPSVSPVSLPRYLKSTAGNIQLINSFRNRDYDVSEKTEERLFSFWMEFFIEATKQEFLSTRFPVSLGHVTSHPWSCDFPSLVM